MSSRTTGKKSGTRSGTQTASHPVVSLMHPPSRRWKRVAGGLVVAALVFSAGWTLGKGSAEQASARSAAQAATQAANQAAAQQRQVCDGYFGTPAAVAKELGAPRLQLDAAGGSISTGSMVCDYLAPTGKHTSTVAVVLGVFEVNPGNPSAVKGTTSSVVVSSGSLWGIAASSSQHIVITAAQKPWLTAAVRRVGAALKSGGL
ncbi:MAG: hypothetical protein ACYCV7_02965 [Acidimicrobiales bacterium]